MLGSVLAVATAHVDPVVPLNEIRTLTFPNYVELFGKFFNSASEYAVREQAFIAEVGKVAAHNARPGIYKMGINRFSDLSEGEFKSTSLGYKPSPQQLNGGLGAHPTCEDDLWEGPIDDLPLTVDWRTADPPVLTAVKDQGQCGSCWAFATTETIESHLAQQTGKLVTLSPQNVTSCTLNPDSCGGTGGCEGGTAEIGFGFVQQYGITTDDTWPYTATTGVCTDHSPVATVTGCVKVLGNSYNATMRAVSRGPVAINVDASSWRSYYGGIFNACDAQATYDINHVVQLVGYGVQDSTPYWVVRNSWGPSWGEGGFIRILRHTDGSSDWCKQDTTAQDGVACASDPSTVTTCGECGVWYDVSYPVGGYYL